MKYTILVPEMHYAVVSVEAKDEKEAMAKASHRYASDDDDGVIYSHTLNESEWKLDISKNNE
jgi:hypothetical protein